MCPSSKTVRTYVGFRLTRTRCGEMVGSCWRHSAARRVVLETTTKISTMLGDKLERRLLVAPEKNAPFVGEYSTPSNFDVSA